MKYQNWDTFTQEQKQFAVNEELRLITHNGTTREDLLNCLRFQAAESDTLKKALIAEIHDSHTDLSPASHKKLFDHYIQQAQPTCAVNGLQCSDCTPACGSRQ